MEARDKRTTVQIQCPDIISRTPPTIGATEDEEVGTNQSQGMEATAAGPGTLDDDAGPLSRCWNARRSDQLARLDIKRSDMPRLRK